MTTPLARWRIAFYEDARGRNPVQEYLDQLPVQEQVEAEEAFSLLREFGILLGMPHAPLWELRPGANRIFYFAHTGRQFILLHAFRKQSQKTPEREIRQAEKRLAQFLEEYRESTR